ncbi:calponin homology domain-containing protein [Jimgerdemannia flammicorona]|uniref:Calponin homology domain-containing protein n=1 Tax=Jimgerdemannia flammicorona TaxID=994334 RepID=A0A433QVU9_9FUNG|nr:calponin homology domain-containing protein [Jimgerdemannia flammicorona]
MPVNVFQLQKRYPAFTVNDINGLIAQFEQCDMDADGYLEQSELIKACQEARLSESYDEIRATLKQVNTNSSGKIDVDEFVEGSCCQTGFLQQYPERNPAIPNIRNIFSSKLSHSHTKQLASKLREGRNKGAFDVHQHKITVMGANQNTSHTINEDERTEFTHHINSQLDGDRDIGKKLPIPTNTMQLFDECRDGLILCKLINDAVPDTIDERVLNTGKKINQFQMIENNNIVINSAKAIGCSVVNIGPNDIMEGREHLILGLIWQIIKRGLLSKIDIKHHPELYRLLDEDETLDEFLRLPPDQILLRWFNYHLKAANWQRRVSNFSKDVSDGENYTILLSQLGADVGITRAPLQERDLLKRAELWSGGDYWNPLGARRSLFKNLFDVPRHYYLAGAGLVAFHIPQWHLTDVTLSTMPP